MPTLPPSYRKELRLSCRCRVVSYDARSGPEEEQEWPSRTTRKLK
jgi:hypothetical protein